MYLTQFSHFFTLAPDIFRAIISFCLNSWYSYCITYKQPCTQVKYVSKKPLLTGAPNPFWVAHNSEGSWSIWHISRGQKNRICLALKRQDWGSSNYSFPIHKRGLEISQESDSSQKGTTKRQDTTVTNFNMKTSKGIGGKNSSHVNHLFKHWGKGRKSLWNFCLGHFQNLNGQVPLQPYTTPEPTLLGVGAWIRWTLEVLSIELLPNISSGLFFSLHLIRSILEQF